VPAPVLRAAKEPTTVGVIHYGSTSAAMEEASVTLEAQGIHADTLRVRGFPFSDAVLDFILRQIKGKGPLARNDASQENDAFLTIMSRTFIGDRIIGGPEMADSLLVRHSRRMEQGGGRCRPQHADSRHQDDAGPQRARKGAGSIGI